MRSNENKIDKQVGRLVGGREALWQAGEVEEARGENMMCAWVSLLGIADSILK